MARTRSIFLLFSALIISLLINEVIVAKLLRYPSYGVIFKVRYRKGADRWTNVPKPYAKIYNVEGDVLTHYNNLGLPGVNVKNRANSIVVLGTSIVEALQFKPDQIATSLFQMKLTESGSNKSVLNLSCSGHDPYDSWFRLQYYEKMLGFKSQEILLVLNSANTLWFTRHPKPFDFSLASDFGYTNNSFFPRALIKLRNTSSLAELYIYAFKPRRNVKQMIQIINQF